MRVTRYIFATGALTLVFAATAPAQGGAVRLESGQEPRSQQQQQQPELARLRAEIERMRAKITEIERRLGQQAAGTPRRAETPSTPGPARPTPPRVAAPSTPGPAGAVPRAATPAPGAPLQAARPRAGAGGMGGGMMVVPGQGPARLAVPVQPPKAEPPKPPEAPQRARVEERRREPVEREGQRARIERRGDEDEGREVWVIRGGRPFAAGLLGRLRAHRMAMRQGGCPMCPHCQAQQRDQQRDQQRVGPGVGQGRGLGAGRWVERQQPRDQVKPGGPAALFRRQVQGEGQGAQRVQMRRQVQMPSTTQTQVYELREVKEVKGGEKGDTKVLIKEKIDAPESDADVVPIFNLTRRISL